MSASLHCSGLESRGQVVEEAIQAVLSSVDMQVVLERTARLLRRHFGATRVTINRVVPEDRNVAEVVLVDDPRFPSPELNTRFALEGSVCGEAIRRKRPFVLEAIRPDGQRYREERLVGPYGYGSLASFPLLFEGEVLGTLDIAHVPEQGFLEGCLRVAEQVAGLVAIALHNSAMVEEVRRLNRLLDRENALLKDEIRQVRQNSRYVAESPLMAEVMAKVRMVAPSDATVLVRGETGTGKEGLARCIHQFSGRFASPFVVVNLGAIPESLIESELFGHEKGAFTGATRQKPGKFEMAAGGTLFLDEVGDAPMPVQVKLLRALQEREIQRVGGTGTIPVNVRVVAATNRPLERMVEEGTFRSDLYYRLNIFPIHIPPLRERREDIRPLATYFLARHAAAMHRKPPAVSEAVWAVLEGYDWPGNVRELENFLARALILSPGPELKLPEFPGMASATGGNGRPAGPAAASPAPACSVEPFDVAVKRVLERALQACGGRIYGPRGAARVLGLKPTTLQGKLRKYGLR